jgi:hypothetical protein
MRYTSETRAPLIYVVDLAQDCLEMRFDGFAEWRKPEVRDRTRDVRVRVPIAELQLESDGWEMPQIAAARVNRPTWHNARKYLICRSSIRPIRYPIVKS